MSIENSNLAPIQGLWIGECLSQLEALTICSFQRVGHPFHLYCYQDLANVPEGTILKDANEILPKNEIYQPLCQFADWFRYLLLYKKGGWWSDLDVICLKPLTFTHECVFGWQDEHLINTAILRFDKRHGMLRELSLLGHNPNTQVEFDSPQRLREKRLRSFRWPSLKASRLNIPWAEIAPVALTEAVKEFDMETFARPIREFYPIHWSEWELLFNGKLSLHDSRFEQTYTIHLWNEMISRSDLRKEKRFSKNSIVQGFLNEYNLST